MLNFHKYRPFIIFQLAEQFYMFAPQSIKHFSNIAVALVWRIKKFLADESGPRLRIRIHYIQIQI